MVWPYALRLIHFCLTMLDTGVNVPFEEIRPSLVPLAWGVLLVSVFVLGLAFGKLIVVVLRIGN